MNKPVISERIDVFLNKDGSVEVFNKINKKSYRLGKKEYGVLKELDGTNTCADLSKKIECFSYEMIENLISKFEKMGFIKGKEEKSKFNILKIRLRIMNPNAVLKPENLLVKLVYFFIMYLSVPLFLIGVFMNIKELDLIVTRIQNNIVSPTVIVIIPLFFIVLGLHEIGHAVVARYNGMNVAEFGFMIYWFMPCAYTNLNGLAFVEKRRKRLSILFAGVLVNIALVGIGLIFLRFVEGSIYNFVLWFSLSNFTICFTNMIVFLKYDGYYILEQFIEVKNLRESSFLYLKTLYKRKKHKYAMNQFNGEIINNEYNSNPLENGVYLMSGILSYMFIGIIVINIILILGSVIWGAL